MVRQAHLEDTVRLMRAAGLVGACRRKGTATTRRHDERDRPVPDQADRTFKVDAPDRLWIAHIIHVAKTSGFLYLAVVLDVFSRRVLSDRCNTTCSPS